MSHLPLAVLVTLLLTSSGAAQVTQIMGPDGDGNGNVLDGLADLVVDTAGNVYVTGSQSNNVFMITDPCGDAAVTQIMDATAGLQLPIGIAVDGPGNVYVAGLGAAFQVTPEGVITQIMDVFGDGQFFYFGGTDVVVSPPQPPLFPGGVVYVSSSSVVFGIAVGGGAPGAVVTPAGDVFGNLLESPAGIAVDDAQNLYVAGLISDNVFQRDGDNFLQWQIMDATGDGAGNALGRPNGVALDAAGNVYVCGEDSDNVFKITNPNQPTQAITKILDATGDGLGNVLDGAYAVEVDGAGNVYVTGAVSDNAFRITPTGMVMEIIDATGDGSGNLLDEPRGLGVDAAGNVFVGGHGSNNVFKISAAECFLVVGEGEGSSPFADIGHLFQTQVGPTIEGAWPVLLDDFAEFVLPSPRQPASRGPIPGQGQGLGPAASGLVGGALAQGAPLDHPSAPAWMEDGQFAVQVVMWNPQVFPGQPEQYTSGLLVTLQPDGSVVSERYGSNLGGMQVWHEVGTNAAGQAVIRFPFSIPGL